MPLEKCECQWDAHFGARTIRHTIAHPYEQEFEAVVPVVMMPGGAPTQKCEMCARHHGPHAIPSQLRRANA